MKKLLLISLLLITSSIILGQTAYIEVKGEPDLSVYLNGKYKGKTTAEFKGLIIENVSAGSNLIKIEKEGYTPFEETITVKAGEVLAYKVKPFTKHKVYVSEEGNTAETDKKATVETGKLVIQSLPIEIKITIPDIDGVNNFTKTKDKWQADEIPAGNYKITFTYNQKVITKTVEIMGSETTSLFVNMLSGDFKTSNTQDEKKEKYNFEKMKLSKAINFTNSLCEKYKFKKGLTESEFINYNPEAAKIITPARRKRLDKNSNMYFRQNYRMGINNIMSTGDIVFRYKLMVIEDEKGKSQSNVYFSDLLNAVQENIPKEYFRYYTNDRKDFQSIKITIPNENLKIDIDFHIYSMGEKYEHSHIEIDFLADVIKQ